MTDRRWELPATARSAVRARRHVTNALEKWHLEALSDAAALLTSELVTNSVLHARTSMTLSVSRDHDTVRVSVTDGSPLTPSLRRHSPTSTTGRGIQLISRLADEWGAESTGPGKTVWFTLSGGRDPWLGYRDQDWLHEAEA
jgi:anti-sigma regulatory factor (Ser/Thr protein kinase)